MASRFQFALPDPRPRDGWFRVGKFDVTTTAILVVSAVSSMFLYALSTTAFYKLAFVPELVRSGDLWRLVTWPIPNPPTSIWVVLTLLFVWFIGHAVEEMLGRSRYTALIAVLIVVPATIVTALPPESFPTLPAVGLSLLGTPLFVVFAAEHPNAPFFFGVPAWIIAAVFIGIDVLRIVGDRFWGTLVMMVLAITLALVIIRQWGFAARLSFIPNLSSAKPHAPRRGPRHRGPRRSARRSVRPARWSRARGAHRRRHGRRLTWRLPRRSSTTCSTRSRRPVSTR